MLSGAYAFWAAIDWVQYRVQASRTVLKVLSLRGLAFRLRFQGLAWFLLWNFRRTLQGGSNHRR